MKINAINVMSFKARTKMTKEEFEAYYDSLYPGSEEERVDTKHCGSTLPFDDDFEGYGSKPIAKPYTAEEIAAIHAKNQFEAEQARQDALKNTPRMTPEEFEAYYDSLYPGSEEDRVDTKDGGSSMTIYPDDNY